MSVFIIPTLISNKVRLVKNFILDLFFPKFCLGCRQEGKNWLCPKCSQKIVFVKTQICPGCQCVSLRGKFCQQCRKSKALSGITVTCYYDEGPIRELIHNFKYHHIKELGNFLGGKMANVFTENFPSQKDVLLVPVPLYFLRERWRGYNQAEILAGMIGQKLKMPWENMLRKTRSTKRQVDLEGVRRRKNLANVFKKNSKAEVNGKKIVLIDDISTTGTTLEECAKVLKSSGAKEVWGLVVARG